LLGGMAAFLVGGAAFKLLKDLREAAGNSGQRRDPWDT
jgi:hypothetical protein